MGPTVTRDLDVTELAEIYRLINPDEFYYGDPPEKWARNILLKQIRVQMVRIRRAAHDGV